VRRGTSSKPVVGLIIVSLLLVGCSRGDSAQTSDSGLPSKAADAGLAIPLSGSLPAQPLAAAAAPASWAIVPMGILSQTDNTFWQLFVTSAAGAKWTLVTPQGVADNGGLAIATSPTGAVVGFDVSQDLGFSPLASTVSGGKSWTPAVLPQALTPVPDALAAEAGGNFLALAGHSGWTIDSSDNAGASTADWSSGSQVGATTRGSCRVIALTAIAYGPAEVPVAGAACAASENVGLYQRLGRSWQLIGGTVPAAALAIAGSKAGSATEVERVWTFGTTLMGLATAVSSGGTSCLFGFHRSAGGVWTTSAVFASAPSEHLVATGYGPDGSAFALISTGHSLLAEILSATSGTWHQLPAPPTGTQTLVLGPGGSTEAFVVATSKLTIDGLTAAGTWEPRQVMDVPVPLGSSG